MLQLQAAEAGFVTRLVESPAGEALEALELPGWARRALEAPGDESLAADRKGARGVERLPFADGSFRPSLARQGQELFAGLMRGRVGEAFAISRSLALSRADGGLRIWLSLDLSERRVAPLAQLPWEALHGGRSIGFLAQDRRTPVLRALSLPQVRPLEPPSEPVLKILAVSGAQLGAPLDLEREWAGLEEAVAGQVDLELLDGRGAVLSRIREAVLRERVQVLHFMGHGQVDEEGRLLLEAEPDVHRVGGSLLAQQLRDLPTLRLVFLNACSGSRAGTNSPFASVANELLLAGVPAVIAMAGPIPDAAALRLSRVFYRSWSVGDSVEEALTEARLAVAALEDEAWAAPALFLRARSVDVLRRESAAVRVSEQPEGRKRTGPLRRLWVVAGVLGAVALAAGYALLDPAASLGPRVPDERGEAPPTQPDSPSSVGAEAGTVASQAESVKPDPEPEGAVETVPVEAIEAPGFRIPKAVPSTQEADSARAEKASPKAGPVRIEHGVPRYLPELRGFLLVEFDERFGTAFARFSFTPDQGEALPAQPLLAPGRLDLKRIDRSIAVLALDFEHRTAVVKLAVP